MKKQINKLLIPFLLYLVFLNFSTLQASNQAPNISATSAIVLDAQTGFILYEKNSHNLQYPASIAKIMTALIALEQYGTRLDTPVYFSTTAVYSVPPNYSHIAMNMGETLTMEDALYAIMVSSANEVANAIAEHISGDMETFSQLMNRRARALGATNTTFTNSSGIHDPGMRTTAYDMAIIMREAMRYPKFIELISTVRHDIPPTEFQPLTRELLNSNRFLRSGQHFNESVVGGKTGFTIPAQHTLATYANRDDRRLIIITLEGAGSYLYTDTRNLMDYAFNMQYQETKLFSQGERVKEVPVYDSWGGNSTRYGEVNLRVPRDIYVNLPPGFDVSEVEHQIYAPSRLIAPIQAGQDIGRIVYTIRGITLGDVLLRAESTVLTPAVTTPTAIYIDIGTTQPPELYGNYTTVLGIQGLLDNYLLTVVLPLTIFFAGLLLSVIILRAHHSKRQAKLGHHYVIGKKI